ncbi:MAG TPA: DcaP family trimeric outer membrane transporter [Candidatus Polarisedimenticolia bacterium]|nr:DcaP family trimeric outer membrane transporter [Candidatus Polarisedimenticolia bacterium]
MSIDSVGRAVLLAWITAALVAAAPVPAQAEEPGKGRMELYGFAMLDMGYEDGQSDPDWFDVMRPTKLPSVANEFGGDGRTYAGVRQSRFGVKTFSPIGDGELKTIFEFELFGVGTDAGQTTFRLRHAWGEYRQWGAGQSWSPFMDPDVFPNSIEYWGPNGMVFFRNVQVRYMPMQGDNELFIALERPGASGDPGVLVGAPAVALTGRFPLPDLSGHYRRSGGWGHVQIAGILRRMEWDDSDPLPPDASGSETGWGVNLSSNLKFDKDILKLQVVYGEGIANYMNDATADVGALAPGDPDIGEALPLVGVVAFYDRTWSEKWTSSFGYSMVDIDNSAGQLASAFKKGQYALANLLYYPVKNLMWGGEVQWGDRENFSDGFSVDDLRVQFSVRYNFSHTLGGQS